MEGLVPDRAKPIYDLAGLSGMNRFVRMSSMVSSRPATVRTKAAAKASAPAAGVSKTPSGTKAPKGDRMVADLLRDLQIDGKALSDQIERLRHRFL